MTPEICPHCGAHVPPNAKACPACGSDEETGWSEETYADGLDLPEEKFDYDDFVEREFGSRKPVPRGLGKFWWIIAILVLAAFLFLLLR